MDPRSIEKITIKREGAGSYTAKSKDFIYHIFTFKSDYGDIQWGVDKETPDGRSIESMIFQCDTLRLAKASIIDHERELK